MDLYEIRKKAKEKKEAEDMAERPDDKAVDTAGEPSETVAGKPAPKKPSGKAPKKAAGKSAPKRKKKAAAEPEAGEPAPDEAAASDVDEALAGMEAEGFMPEETGPGSGVQAGDVLDEFSGEGEIFIDVPDIPLDELMQQAFEAEKAEEVAEEVRGDMDKPESPETEPGPAGPAVEPVRAKAPAPEVQSPKAAGTPQEVMEEGGEGEAEAENVIEYLAFMLSEEEYAVKVSDIKEIIRPQKITMVPRAPEFVEGIFSLRGVIIPVFDIKKRLGFQHSERDRTARILIVSDGGAAQGMIVDRVTGVARLKADAIEPPPTVIGGVEAEYLEGIGRLDGRMLILFNTSRVLSMEG